MSCYLAPDAPIPAKTPNKTPNNAKGVSKYKFAELEIGQSFMVPNKNNLPAGETLKDATTLGNMRTHVSRHNNKIMPGKVFKCRVFPDNPCWIQVWRVS